MPVERHIEAFADQADVLATLDVGKMWDRMLGEFLGEFARLDRQGLSDEAIEAELRAFMQGLSDRPVQDLARQTSAVAYNQGRAAEQLSAFEAGEVDFVVRSELLEDVNTCQTCKDLDGFTADIGTPEYYEFHPPAKCEGLDKCRGFYVALRK